MTNNTLFTCEFECIICIQCSCIRCFIWTEHISDHSLCVDKPNDMQLNRSSRIFLQIMVEKCGPPFFRSTYFFAMKHLVNCELWIVNFPAANQTDTKSAQNVSGHLVWITHFRSSLIPPIQLNHLHFMNVNIEQSHTISLLEFELIVRTQCVQQPTIMACLRFVFSFFYSRLVFVCRTDCAHSVILVLLQNALYENCSIPKIDRI